MNRSSKRIAFAALAAMVVLVSGCSGKDAEASKGGGKNGAGRKGAMAFPVEVQNVSVRSVEYTISAVGSVEAFERVDVTARVAGAIERVRFIEGQVLPAGSILVEIEPERFRLAVEAARANVNKTTATLREAEAALARREAANNRNPGLIPAEEVQTFRTRVSTARAEIEQMVAALRQAELNLRDAYVRAPVSGVIQTRSVNTGQYVPVGTVLATLVRRDPLLVRFNVPEQEAKPLRVGMPIRLAVNEGAQPFSGRIRHIAGSAATDTRMVQITGDITDPQRARLTPGAFARVEVPIGGVSAAPVVPQTAIRPSERGFLAFVIEDETARERTLTLGMRTADGMVEVKSGLAAGEQLVVRGAEPLREGAKVRVSKKVG